MDGFRVRFIGGPHDGEQVEMEPEELAEMTGYALGAIDEEEGCLVMMDKAAHMVRLEERS